MRPPAVTRHCYQLLAFYTVSVFTFRYPWCGRASCSDYNRLSNMSWAKPCARMGDLLVDLRHGRCHQVNASNDRVSSSLLFVVGTCIPPALHVGDADHEHQVSNFLLFHTTVSSIRRFHPTDDILVVDSCAFPGLRPFVDAHNRQQGHAARMHLVTEVNGSRFEFGAVAEGVRLLLRGGYENLVFLQHSTSLTTPIPAYDERSLNDCPTSLGGSWNLDADPLTVHQSWHPPSLLPLLHERGVPPDLTSAYTAEWISFADGTIALPRQAAQLLSHHGLFDEAIVQGCATKGCWESLSGLYSAFVGQRWKHKCGALHIHDITRKVSGSSGKVVH